MAGGTIRFRQSLGMPSIMPAEQRGGEHEGDSGVRAGSEGGAEVANLELLEHIERGDHQGR